MPRTLPHAVSRTLHRTPCQSAQGTVTGVRVAQDGVFALPDSHREVDCGPSIAGAIAVPADLSPMVWRSLDLPPLGSRGSGLAALNQGFAATRLPDLRPGARVPANRFSLPSARSQRARALTLAAADLPDANSNWTTGGLRPGSSRQRRPSMAAIAGPSGPLCSRRRRGTRDACLAQFAGFRTRGFLRSAPRSQDGNPPRRRWSARTGGLPEPKAKPDQTRGGGFAARPRHFCTAAFRIFGAARAKSGTCFARGRASRKSERAGAFSPGQSGAPPRPRAEKRGRASHEKAAERAHRRVPVLRISARSLISTPRGIPYG